MLENFKSVKKFQFKRISAISKNIVAGGDAPEDYSDKQTKEYCVPIYSNGIVNKGLYGYAKEAVIKEPSVTVSARGTIGYVQERLEPYVPIVRLITITPKENEILLKYLKYVLEDAYFKNTGAQTPQLTVPKIKKIKIPVPDIDEQKRIIEKILPLEAEIEKLQKEIDSVSAKRQTILDKYLK